jgi:hypothetical protein
MQSSFSALYCHQRPVVSVQRVSETCAILRKIQPDIVKVQKLPREIHFLLSDFNETSILLADFSKNTSKTYENT